MTHLVYKARNVKNGKSYVGITARSLTERRLEHQKRAREGVRNSRLYQAMRKYGAESFDWTVLAEAGAEQEVRALETHFIRQFDTMNSGYNCNEGGAGFLNMPEHIKRKIGDAQRGKVISDECKAKMSAFRKENPNPENFGEHLSKGASNPRATWFAMSCPDGLLRIQCGLRDFVRDHGLHMRHLKARGRSKGFHLLDRFNLNAVPPTALALT
jgi:group I intron endonuclease